MIIGSIMIGLQVRLCLTGCYHSINIMGLKDHGGNAFSATIYSIPQLCVVNRVAIRFLVTVGSAHRESNLSLSWLHTQSYFQRASNVLGTFHTRKQKRLLQSQMDDYQLGVAKWR